MDVERDYADEGSEKDNSGEEKSATPVPEYEDEAGALRAARPKFTNPFENAGIMEQLIPRVSSILS